MPPRKKRAAAPPPPPRRVSLGEPEIVVSDAVGRLMAFWGFKRNMGRVWSLLYLTPSPLTAQDLQDLLQISSGAVSMTLAELTRWGVVKKVWVQGERRDYYAAEVGLWRMISRVLGERERAEIISAVDAFERAVEVLEDRRRSSTGSKEARAGERSSSRGNEVATRGSDLARERARTEFELRRVRSLLDLARLGRTLLDALVSSAKVDAEPLARFLLGVGRDSSGG
jgi:DNA-binding transcriptional regulator GbsR (MarR family)